MYDAIVVGARCAGAATALLLAGAGHHVLLLDQQAGFPTETMSTRYIHQPGVARLMEWGVLPSVLAAGCRPIRHLSHRVSGRGDSVTVAGDLPAFGGAGFAIAPRRQVLDGLLAAEARAAEAEFRPDTKVVDLLWRGERVTGVITRAASGDTRPELARVVIGADGMRSAVARLAGAAVTADDGRRTFVHYSQWRLGDPAVRLVESSGRYLGVIPTDEDICLLATYAPQAEFAQARTDAAAFHRGIVACLAPDLDERLRETERVGTLIGSGDQQNFFRQAAGPGWVLVGDAGHHKDSITARGITDAFAQAELLAGTLAGRCGSDADADAALAEYARRRDALLLDSYQATLRTTDLAVTDRRLSTLAEVASSRALTDRYLGVLAGMRPADDLVPVLTAG
jgi:flavin-dependent dehydrogenase